MRDAIGERNLDFIDATGIATALMGDTIATNPFMLGFAFQQRRYSARRSMRSLRAIELNGVAVDANKRAFAWGRLAAHDMARVRQRARFRSRAVELSTETLDDEIIALAPISSPAIRTRPMPSAICAGRTRSRTAESARAARLDRLDRGGAR